jgi:PAS domain S-box-containing protein
VTHRAQAAEALAFVGDGILLVDRAGVVRLWNATAEAITGLVAADVVGRPAHEAIPSWEALAAQVTPTDAPGRTPSGNVVTLSTGDGDLFLSVVGVRFHAGSVFAFRDLTAERAVEKLKTDFVSTVSHELRTPLAGVYGAAMTLRRADVDFDEDQRKVLLDVIAAEAGRLARIVEDILSAGQLDANTLTLSVERCDAGELAAEALRAAQTRFADSAAIGLHVDAGTRVVADRSRLLQVLGNLIDNAVKYSAPGEPVDITIASENGSVRLAVSDRGLGIPHADLERVFDKFFRLDPELARGVGGTGLGLYICRELVELMAGRIWAEARTGGGSTFVVELPAG